VTSVTIYGLRAVGTPEIRYVGQTGDLRTRLANHMSRSRKHDGPLARWLRSVGPPEVVVLEECRAEQANAAEEAWMHALRQVGCKLLNVSKTGNRPDRRIPSPLVP
jgi:predicted GIY-YIG superfamily endonuclease